MASAVDTQKIASKQKVELWDHDPGATTAIVVSPDGGTTVRTVDLRDYRYFGVGAMATIAGTGITKLEIIAAAAATMASPVVVKDSGTIAADAVGDWAWEECTAEEVAQLASENGVDLRYVAGRITMGTGTDEAAVVYVSAGPRFAYENLTPDTTIS